MNRDLMNLALEALECHGCPWIRHEKEYAAIQALRAELSKPEPEPVAWMSWRDDGGFGFWETKTEAESYCDEDEEPQPLYLGVKNES